jgi:DNA excision repair protein ERCC-2
MSGEDLASACEFFAHKNLRDSQKEMLLDSINVLEENGFLIASAPTGIGKTAASLAAALKIKNKSRNGKKILFLTGRQSQHKIVVDTIKKINQKLSNELQIKLTDMIGRESMCNDVNAITGECSCEDGIEERARRSNRMKLVNKILEQPMHVEDVIRLSRDEEICAWASARISAKDADVIVCDYNHVFIENVMKSSLSSMGVELSNSILIVDEAHNLPDRVRNGLETFLQPLAFQHAYDETNEYLGNKEKEINESDIDNTFDFGELEGIRTLKRQLNKLKKDMEKWYDTKERELGDKKDMKIETNEFLNKINESLMESLDAGLTKKYEIMERMIKLLYVIVPEELGEDEEETACSRLAYLLEICIEYRDNSALALVIDRIPHRGREQSEHTEQPIRVHSFLLDPGVVSGPLFEQTSGSILMSGTLYPPSMYSDVLQIPEDRKNVTKEYRSDFLSNRRPILIARDVTTKFTSRGLSNTNKINQHIFSTIENSKGNVALFFPSYVMMEKFRTLEEEWLPQVWPSIRVIEEKRAMSKREIENSKKLLYELESNGERGVLMGVLGGKFSEGVDYPDNILQAVICVGLPLAPPSARQDALKKYYEKRFGNSLAWRYSSSQPAVNSLMQAIGRPIRKGEDRALVVLLENRLLQRNYKICMPSSLQTIEVSNPERTGKWTTSFFEYFPEPAKENNETMG